MMVLDIVVVSSYRLALYVYEYLLHIGAQKSAQTFLSEVRGYKLRPIYRGFPHINSQS